MSIVKLSSLTKIYDGFTAVNGVNMQIEYGEILGLIGHNGAGKTTTIKMMVGLLAPTSGLVEVMGHNMAQENTRVKQQYRLLAGGKPALRKYDYQAILIVLFRTVPGPSPYGRRADR